ncbi:acyltransferase [Novosphingobium sp. B-7]|uniref:acyltransferase family protein n=1 Tax=Novosphingobium sp. B-7 TaxID=1298855 RepID=UPI0003B5BB66|nr:acyltransferase [Novosphingobium sp. B-7]
MTIAKPMTRSAGPHALIGIQYLRAVAALMVVIFHLEPQLHRMGYANFWPKGLSSGVDMFFVISGLIMWVTTSGRAVGVIDFWQRRVTRIAPLYWAFTLLMVILMLIAPNILQSSRYDSWHVLASFLFLPAQHPVMRSMEPVVMPGWTLNYEMFFYLIFGLWLLAPERWRAAGNAATIGLLVGIGVVLDLSARNSVGGFYTSSIMIEFVLGTVLGVLVTRGGVLSRISIALAWVVLTGGIAFAVLLPTTSSDLPRAITRGIPAFLTVGAILVLELRGRIINHKGLRFLGDASYSLYLSHFVILSMVSQVWRRLPIAPSPLSYIAFGIVAVGISLIGGALCYRFVEQPLTALFQPARRPIPQSA